MFVACHHHQTANLYQSVRFASGITSHSRTSCPGPCNNPGRCLSDEHIHVHQPVSPIPTGIPPSSSKADFPLCVRSRQATTSGFRFCAERTTTGVRTPTKTPRRVAVWCAFVFSPPLFAVLLGKDSRRKVFVSRGTSTGWPRDGRGSSSDGDGGVLEARVLETQLYVYDCTVGFIIVVRFITVQHSTIPDGMVVVVLEYVLTCVLSEVRRRVQLPTQKGTVTLLLYYYADLWYLGVIAQRKRI